MLVVAHIFQVGMRHSSVSLRFRLFYHPHIRATPMYSCVYLYTSHISLFTALCFLLFLFSHWNNGKNRWELDTSAKQETWQGSLWGQRKIVDIFGKKSTNQGLQKQKILFGWKATSVIASPWQRAIRIESRRIFGLQQVSSLTLRGVRVLLVYLEEWHYLSSTYLCG